MPKEEPEVFVRPAARKDIPDIVKVCLTSVTEEEVVGFGAPLADSPFRDAERLSSAWTDPNRIGSSEMFVAEIDGVVAGVTEIREGGEALELVDIEVSREQQGRGVGKQMVEFVEGLARERRKRAVTLGTSKNSEGVPWKSLPWWKARGYRVTHEEEKDWTRSIGPGVREIRMRKELYQPADNQNG